MRGQRAGENIRAILTQGRWSESLETPGRGDQGAGRPRCLNIQVSADEGAF